MTGVRMTFPHGPRADASSGAPRAAWKAVRAGLSRDASSRLDDCRRGMPGGFTLLELVLVLSLLVLLGTLAVVNFGGVQRKALLNEGVERFQTTVMLLRAEAANQGVRVRLAFEQGDDELWQPVVLWERDPLVAPGEFTAYEGAGVREHLPGSIVRVAVCRLTGSSAYQTLSGVGMADDEEACVPVTFYPDGSCDSAEIHLVSADPGDSRVAVFKISGLTGRTECTVYSAEEYLDIR